MEGNPLYYQKGGGQSLVIPCIIRKGGRAIPCIIRREGGQSLVIPCIIKGREGNPLYYQKGGRAIPCNPLYYQEGREGL